MLWRIKKSVDIGELTMQTNSNTYVKDRNFAGTNKKKSADIGDNSTVLIISLLVLSIFLTCDRIKMIQSQNTSEFVFSRLLCWNYVAKSSRYCWPNSLKYFE